MCIMISLRMITKHFIKQFKESLALIYHNKYTICSDNQILLGLGLGLGSD